MTANKIHEEFPVSSNGDHSQCRLDISAFAKNKGAIRNYSATTSAALPGLAKRFYQLLLAFENGVAV